jgi:hypothetical protein
LIQRRNDRAFAESFDGEIFGFEFSHGLMPRYTKAAQEARDF